MAHPTIDDMSIQMLLDSQAAFSNAGRHEENEAVKVLIRHRTKDQQPPHCFGEDDCSTNMLSRCAWRIDCGS